MSCISHVCECGEVFHDNEQGGECPVCGSYQVSSHFDEPLYEPDEDFDEQAEIQAAINGGA